MDRTPGRAEKMGSVPAQGRRRRLAWVGAAAAIALVAVLAVGVFAWLWPAQEDGTDPTTLELPGGFVVDVDPPSAESEGARVYVGLLGPDPLFDTSALGTEVVLTQRSAGALVVPPSANPAERNALRAAVMVYLGDIHGAQIALSVSGGDFFSFGQEDLCLFLGNGTPLAGGGDCSISDGPRAGESNDPPVGGWLVWTNLDAEAAVVQMHLSDGSSFWQRPVARTVYFNLDDGRGLDDVRLTVMDHDGTIIHMDSPERSELPDSVGRRGDP